MISSRCQHLPSLYQTIVIKTRLWIVSDLVYNSSGDFVYSLVDSVVTYVVNFVNTFIVHLDPFESRPHDRITWKYIKISSPKHTNCLSILLQRLPRCVGTIKLALTPSPRTTDRFLKSESTVVYPAMISDGSINAKLLCCASFSSFAISDLMGMSTVDLLFCDARGARSNAADAVDV